MLRDNGLFDGIHVNAKVHGNDREHLSMNLNNFRFITTGSG